MKILFTLAIIAVGVYFLYAKSTQAGGNNMSVIDLQAAINQEENLLVLDVRTLGEWDEGHIKGAKHIPIADLGQRLEELTNFKGTKIAVICRSGTRSAKASAFLVEQGFTDIQNIPGGMMEWEKRKFPSEK